MKADYYVFIKDSVDFRESILEASKDVLASLKAFEKFKHVVVEKQDKVAELRRIMAELHQLDAEIKAKLPALKLKEKEEKHKKHHEGHKAGSKVYSKDIEKLESFITDIEGKLKKFGA